RPASTGREAHGPTPPAALPMAGLLAGRGDLAAAEATAADALSHAQQHRARLETAAALLTLAAVATRAGRDADARDRIGQAAAVIAQCPDPGILAGQLTAAQHQAPLPPPPPPPPPARPPPPPRRPPAPGARAPPPAAPRHPKRQNPPPPGGRRPPRRPPPQNPPPQAPRPHPRRRPPLNAPPRQLTPPRS